MMTRESLVEHIQEGTRVEFHFFWKGLLSQWESNHPFIIDGITYKTAEHWMMSQKAMFFKDTQSQARIIEAPSPSVAKDLGRTVHPYDDEAWSKVRVSVVRMGNIAKFSQHRDLAVYLDSTGHKVLVEASPKDKIWGVGLLEHHPDATSPHLWPGQNLLGFTLMDVREIIRADGVV